MKKKERKISLIGFKKTKKDYLFKELSKKIQSISQKERIMPDVNYSEIIIKIKEREIILINMPYLDLYFNNEDLLKNKKKEMMDEIISSSEILILLINIEKNNEKIIPIIKILKKRGFDNILLIIEENDDDNFEELTNGLKKIVKIIPDFFFYSSLIKNEFSSLIKKIEFIINKNSEALNDYDFENNIKINEKINEPFTISIIGPPNTGKSTLMNGLLDKNRSLISSLEGTTKEKVISYFNLSKEVFKIIDTSGISEKRLVDFKLLKESDIILFVIDSTNKLTNKIFNMLSLIGILKKSSIIIINKCDLIDKKTKNKIENEIKRRLKSIKDCPIIKISALKKKSISYLIRLIQKMFIQSKKKFAKKEIEILLKEMIDENPPKIWNGGKLKIYFAKHEEGWTHTFIFFVNNPKFIHFSYQRFILNYIKKKLLIEMLPIKMFFKKSK